MTVSIPFAAIAPWALSLGLFAAPLVIVSLACSRVTPPPAPETVPVGENTLADVSETASTDSKVDGPIFAAGESEGSLEPVAVVELFTSEGCSSCPPADENLSRLADQARQNGTRIYPLSFHVDYWNYLGWRDPFSSEEYSERQRNYAGIWRSRRVYTPQMIVNGSKEFVGSQRSQSDEAIRVALGTKAKAAIALKVSANGARGLKVTYSVKSDVPDLRLNLAALQRQGKRAIPAGENAGLTLAHRNIVRRFKSLKLVDSKGSWEVELPSDVASKDAMVIAYAQQEDGVVVGAGAASPVN